MKHGSARRSRRGDDHDGAGALGDSERRAAAVADFARELSESLECEAMIARIVQFSVASFSTCSVVYRIQERRAEAAALAHQDGNREAALAALLIGDAISDVGHPVLTVAGGDGTPLELESRHQVRRALLPAFHAGDAPAFDFVSAVLVPLRARGECLGALVHLFDRPLSDAFEPRVREMAVRMAQSAGLALDNSRLLREAKLATQVREEMLSVVAHDLRSPLGAISVSAEVLMGYELKREQQVHHLEIIQRAAGRMSRLIQDLVDVGQIEAGQLTLEPSRQSVRELADETVQMFQTRAERKRLDLRVEMIDEPLEVHAERYRLLQVLSNLVENAVKFTPADGQIRIEGRRIDDDVLITVRDTGPGVPEHHRPHIFDRFWHGRTQSERGSGLGLAIAKGIVEAHGGTIWLANPEEGGAAFHFTIPAAR